MSTKSETNTNKKKTKPVLFLEFLMQKEQRFELLFFFLLFVVLYVLLIKTVPYPPSISDSGGYINAAATNRIDTYRPFGYSQFLISIHKLSSSIHFLVFVQYFLYAISAVAMIFTIKFFFHPQKPIFFYLFSFFAIFSPLTLYLSNSILSDSLFTSLTILWITSGIWMLYSQKVFYTVSFYAINLILLFFIISVRYTGLVYIGITIPLVVLAFYRKNIFISIILAIIPILLLIGYYKNQKAKVYNLVKVNTFSGFSGWQTANNALNCVPYIKIDPSEFEDPQLKIFADIVSKYDISLFPKETPSAKFMWDKSLPLKAYCFYELDRTRTPYIYQWNYLGENVYSKFGKYIITHHPLEFTKHYLLPNLCSTLYPQNDQIIKHYRTDGIPGELVQSWFKLEPLTYANSKSTLFEKVFSLFPISRLIIWIFVLVAFAFFLIKRRQFNWGQIQNFTFWVLIAFLVLYTAFNVYASPIELRYLAPIHLIQIALIYIVVNSANIKAEIANEIKKEG